MSVNSGAPVLTFYEINPEIPVDGSVLAQAILRYAKKHGFEASQSVKKKNRFSDEYSSVTVYLGKKDLYLSVSLFHEKEYKNIEAFARGTDKLRSVGKRDNFLSLVRDLAFIEKHNLKQHSKV